MAYNVISCQEIAENTQFFFFYIYYYPWGARRSTFWRYHNLNSVRHRKSTNHPSCTCTCSAALQHWTCSSFRLALLKSMKHMNTKLRAQNTNLDSPQIFFIAFLDETPSISPLDWVLEIFKQKWNIKRNQMRVSTKYQRGVTTSSEGWKGKLLVV